MSTPDDHAQRDLERRALRNVRDLVDKIEQGDKADRRTQRRLVVGVVAVMAILAAGLAYMLRSPPSGGVEVPLAKPGQVMPQAPRASQ